MKDITLATKEEVVVHSLAPITVTNRRIYIHNGFKGGAMNLTVKKIIELDDITSISYSLVEYPIYIVLGVIFSILSLGSLGAYLYSIFVNPIITKDFSIFVSITSGLILLLAIIFIIKFKKKKDKTIRIEYPSSASTATEVTYRNVSIDDFNKLISVIYEYKDKLKDATFINSVANIDIEI